MHSNRSLKQAGINTKEKVFAFMKRLLFLDLDSIPFLFRTIQIISADSIQQGQSLKI
jgi:hypothetical protein